ncbi:MAG TPA: FAD:protein FMN transferase [Planctomycetota bacterium]|nr:FAD:protein FMN transferase [Planctomycetota bacterium]
MIVVAATHAMGTRFEAVLAGEGEARLRAAGEEALAEVEEEDRRLSLFRRESLLARVNARAAEAPVRLDPETFDLLEACRAIHRDSGGAFDPTVAPLMQALGFRAEGEAASERVPAALSRVGLDLLVLDRDRGTVRFLRRGVSLDLGGIGKGHALDLAAARLRAAGIDCALLHGGTSSVVGIGAPPGTAGWRVAVRGAEDGTSPPLAAILRDRALSVSAPHGRVVEREGIRLGHVLDPMTGSPAARARAAAAISPSARLADGWTTALLVLGRRPPGAPSDLTSAILGANAEWRIEGPEADLFQAR